MPGPAPKHPSVRQRRNDAKKDFRTLSSDGREGPPPAWPLGPDVALMAELEYATDQVAKLQVEYEEASDGRARGRIRRNLDKLEMQSARLKLTIEMSQDAEVELWNEMWATPQAVLWEESYAHREVAQYVRWKIRGEQGDLKASIEARQLSDRLGLNPLALLRLRAEIEHVDEAEDKGEARRQKAAPPRKSRAKKKVDPRTYLTVVQDDDTGS